MLQKQSKIDIIAYMTKNNIRPFIAWQAALKTKELRSFVPVEDICYIWLRMFSNETEKSLRKMILNVMADDITELQYLPISQVYIQGASDNSDVCDFFGNSGYLAYPDGVLGIFRPKKTKSSTASVSLGLQRAINLEIPPIVRDRPHYFFDIDRVLFKVEAVSPIQIDVVPRHR